MLKIRPATINDISEIAEIHAICWRATYKFMPEEILMNRDKSYRQLQWESWFDENRSELGEGLFIFEDKGGIVGFCMCKPNSDDALPDAKGEIHALYVLPDYRTFGVSYLAAYTLSNYLVERGLSPICCWAFQKNNIWKWYQRLGFKKIIARDRGINGINVPEFGMVHYEPMKLIELSFNQLQKVS